jgi:outer membrane biosynthesis protein TonB
VAWLLPELDIGVEPELRPLELELEPEPVELELPELEPVEVEPEPVEEPEPELVEEPEPDDAEEPEPELVEAVLCVDPGRAKATAPAAATLATVTAVVADRTLARPRARAAMAWRTRSRGALLMCSILRSGTRRLLNEPSRLAMRRAGRSAVLRRGYRRNMKDS